MVFAKSTPIETLFCHTKNVLEQVEILKRSYGTRVLKLIPSQYRDYFWDSFSLICKAHDLGKLQSLFQNKILRACKIDNLLQTIEGLNEIPHNIISPAFIGNHVKNFPAELRPAIYQTIAFHHARGRELLNDKSWSFVEEVIRKDIVSRLYDLEDM